MGKAKNAGGEGGGGKAPIVIANIIIAAICIVAIVTLFIGDFWNADLKMTVDKETIRTLMQSSSSGSSEPSNVAQNINGAEESEEGMTLDEILQYVDDDFRLEFGMSLNLNGPAVAKGAFGQADTIVQDMINDQVNNLVNEVSRNVDDILNVSVKAVVKMAVEKAKAAIKEELKKQMEENNITEEKMDEELAKEGTSLKEINDMLDEFMESVGKMLEGDTEACRTFIKEDAKLTKVINIVVKYDLKDKKGSYTDEELEQGVTDYKNDLIKNYDEMIAEYTIDGEFSTETIIISILNGTGLFELKNQDKSSSTAANAAEESTTEESGEKKFKNMDDVKNYIVEQIINTIGEDTVDTVGKVLSYIGYFLLFIIACWAYVLIKIIIKTIFFKRKTVGLFFPRMFGWFPHVFLVGLPMLIINKLPEIVSGTGATGDEVDLINKILNMFTLSVSSLTWVSALCSVLLTLILVFYYPMRRREKKS